jgi:hypothetical protein
MESTSTNGFVEGYFLHKRGKKNPITMKIIKESVQISPEKEWISFKNYYHMKQSKA